MVGSGHAYYSWVCDIYPVTVGGKVFASVVAMVGIGLVAIPTGLMSAAFVRKMEEQNNRTN